MKFQPELALYDKSGLLHQQSLDLGHTKDFILFMPYFLQLVVLSKAYKGVFEQHICIKVWLTFYLGSRWLKYGAMLSLVVEDE